MVRIVSLIILCAAWLVLPVAAAAQTASDYDTLVQKGKAQLQAGSADLALASGESAIKMNADRWEGYVLAGGALMNLKRYEEAADRFSDAIDRAPEAKQAALRDLRKQCVLAESGASPVPKETTPATTSQAENVLWKTIENSSNPDDFRAYLKQYPNGAFATLARNRLARVGTEGSTAHLRSKSQVIPGVAIREDPKDGLKYVWIPPGTFMMGCSPGDAECLDIERPSHQVKISKGFWLGQTPVTVGAYKRFAQSAGNAMPPEPNFSGLALNSGWQNEAMPMVDVTWIEARDYCAWAGGRLPTEAEWEYAARGGSTEMRYGSLDEVAWYADNSGQRTFDSAQILRNDPKYFVQRFKDNGNGMHEVAQKVPNGFGLFDTLGNVVEWVNDWYDQNYYTNSPSQDPTGPPSGTFRISRGGYWLSIPRSVRVSNRNRGDPGNGYNGLGFRCVEEVDSP